MNFEVIRNGATLMQTEDKSCIYPIDALLTMQADGYSFRFSNKPWAPGKKQPAAKSQQTRRYRVHGKRCAELDGAV